MMFALIPALPLLCQSTLLGTVVAFTDPHVVGSAPIALKHVGRTNIDDHAIRVVVDLLSKRETLCSDPSWEPTIANWIDEGVDDKLTTWWNQVKGNRSTTTFVDLLSSSFGDRSRGQECGIGKSNCFVPNCQPFKDLNGPRWVYFVRSAVVQMHTLFNNIYDASNTAEADYTAVIPDLTNNFFHWKVEVDLKAAQPWITAVVESIFAFIPPARLAALAPTLLAKAVPGLIDTTKNFAGAGTLLIGGSGSEVEIIEKKMGTIQELGDLIKAATQDVRDGIDDWSAQLFSGDPDVTGLSIIDYLKGGRFMLPFMDASDMSSYMFQVRVAWLANRQWIDSAATHSKKFVMCTNATSVPCDDDTRYSDGNRTCCLYQITGKAEYEESKDLATLRSSTYNFNISRITESSVRSWLRNGFDTRERNATEIIMNSLSVNESQFFAHGVGAEGIFALPVCDVSDASWVAKWSDKPNMLPCCCGPYCKDTKAFYQASSMWRKDEYKDSKFKEKLDGRCIKQYPDYIADWSKAAVVKTPGLTLVASCFILVTTVISVL